MAESTLKRANNPRVGNAVVGGGAGYYLAQMIVELANKLGAGLSDDFEKSLAGVLIILCGYWAGWQTRDRDE